MCELCNNTRGLSTVTVLLYLKHRVSEKCLQRPLLTVGLGLILLEQLVEVAVLFAVSQDLQAVLVVPHKLLVDVQHWQQDVEQVSCNERTTYSGISTFH